MQTTDAIIKGMNFSQSTELEGIMQQMFDITNPTYYIFNCYLIGKSAKDLKTEGKVKYDQDFYQRDNFIHQQILNYYNNHPSFDRDVLIQKQYESVYLKEFNSPEEKSKELERLFHSMKKAKIEQESYLLLEELSALNKGKPLETVYNHLYKKYSRLNLINTDVIQYFRDFNVSLQDYLSNERSDNFLKEMVLEFKKIRFFAEKYEHRGINTIFNIAKLILVEVCDQHQFLIRNKVTIEGLFENCKTCLNEYPFGVEKYYLENILEIIECKINIKDAYYLNKFKGIDEVKVNAGNFNFPTAIYFEVRCKLALEEDHTPLKIIQPNIETPIIEIKKIEESLETPSAKYLLIG